MEKPLAPVVVDGDGNVLTVEEPQLELGRLPTVADLSPEEQLRVFAGSQFVILLSLVGLPGARKVLFGMFPELDTELGRVVVGGLLTWLETASLLLRLHDESLAQTAAKVAVRLPQCEAWFSSFSAYGPGPSPNVGDVETK